MTIKELEQRTGMPRANIRYYEEEGLLSPRRLDNGYRDYAEEDVRTLEKIKLLCSLQLDIGTIRLLQQGKLTLKQAMFNQLTRKVEREGYCGQGEVLQAVGENPRFRRTVTLTLNRSETQ